MSASVIYLKDAKITKIKEFTSAKGYGIDMYVEVATNKGPCYYQVVMYDKRAHDAFGKFKVGDNITLTGELSIVNYMKKDGEKALSAVIEFPDQKTISDNEYERMQQAGNYASEQRSKQTEANDQNAPVEAISTEKRTVKDEYGRTIETKDDGLIIVDYNNGCSVGLTKDCMAIINARGRQYPNAKIDFGQGSLFLYGNDNTDFEISSDGKVLKHCASGEVIDLINGKSYYPEPESHWNDDDNEPPF